MRDICHAGEKLVEFVLEKFLLVWVHGEEIDECGESRGGRVAACDDGEFGIVD